MKHMRENKNATIKIVIIADDFTGALDTAIQFAKNSAKTVALTNVKSWTQDIFRSDYDVLAIDTETRHLSKSDAYRIVYKVIRQCMEAGVAYIYKKIDSALRGNIGAELKAVMDASKAKVLPLIPAYPQMNRCTISGVHFVDGVPLTSSVLGQDPFEPVGSSRVANLFLEESIFVKDKIKYDNPTMKADVPQLLIYDAQSTEEMDRIAERCIYKDKLRVVAGCGGFADSFSKMFEFRKRAETPVRFTNPLLILCGSMSEISKRQLEYEECKGTFRVTLDKKKQVRRDYLETEEGRNWTDMLIRKLQEERILMIDTETDNISCELGKHLEERQELRIDIATMLGSIGSRVMNGCENAVIMVIGGDTLLSFLKQMDCKKIVPVEEVETGTVLSKIADKRGIRWIISKSGGFGEKELVSNVIRKLGFERRDRE